MPAGSSNMLAGLGVAEQLDIDSEEPDPNGGYQGLLGAGWVEVWVRRVTGAKLQSTCTGVGPGPAHITGLACRPPCHTVWQTVPARSHDSWTFVVKTPDVVTCASPRSIVLNGR